VRDQPYQDSQDDHRGEVPEDFEEDLKGDSQRLKEGYVIHHAFILGRIRGKGTENFFLGR
jgi:hypothetical protein